MIPGCLGKESRYTTCINHEENFDLKTALDKAVKNLNGRITDSIGFAEEGLQTDVLDADPDVKKLHVYFCERTALLQGKFKNV